VNLPRPDGETRYQPSPPAVTARRRPLAGAAHGDVGRAEWVGTLKVVTTTTVFADIVKNVGGSARA